MAHAARIRRPLFALAALAVAATFAGPSFAGDRATPGCAESPARTKGGSSLEGAAPAASAPARRDNASIEPGEGYVPLSRNAPPAAAPAPRPAEPSSAPVLAPRTEKPAVKANATSRVATPPAPARRAKPGPATTGPAKMSLPNLPATPGMGTLLRVGISAGREIS